MTTTHRIDTARIPIHELPAYKVAYALEGEHNDALLAVQAAVEDFVEIDIGPQTMRHPVNGKPWTLPESEAHLFQVSIVEGPLIDVRGDIRAQTAAALVELATHLLNAAVILRDPEESCDNEEDE